MKTSILVLFLFIQTVIVSAQYSLNGTVRDENGEPLPNANVVLGNTFMIATTGQEGKFEFNNLKRDKYILHISYIGYEPQQKEVDLTKSININITLRIAPVLMEEALVSASRAGENSPIAHTTLSKEMISNENLGQDIPYLLNLTPSFVATSDAGTGIGYTNFRIRGTDLNRINITMNGIPVSDAESHSTYFVDIPDIASSAENIQVQRGVGNSTNGPAAFGATIDLQTSKLDSQAMARYSSSFGSFNTFRNNLSVGSGILNGKFAVNASLSKISSDGYIDRASSELKSFYVSGGYFTEKTILKATIFSGFEQTYQAWNGVPSVRLNNDLPGMLLYQEHGLYTPEETQNMINSNSRTYNLYTYKNQVDHYQQDYYQLHFSHKFNAAWNLNLAGFYTYGRGYYEEYKTDQSYADYNLTPPVINGITIESTDLIRRKWLDNNFYGMIFSLTYLKDKSNLSIGGGGNIYDGDHFGRIIWTKYAYGTNYDYEYYRGNGLKKDYNLYTRYNYQFSEKLNGSIDLQYRHINYEITGIDDKLRDVTQSHLFDFFNPKLGLYYKLATNQNVYINYGRANREPNRDNFVDADPSGKKPTFETLNDFETGYSFHSQGFRIGANLYYMLYKNQLILTGQINDVGSPIMTNVDNSYRAGVEITAGVKFLKIFQWDVNATFSRNKIKNFTEYVENWDTGALDINPLGSTDIAFSPGVIANSTLTCKLPGNFDINLLSSYVSKQFIDNTSSNDRKIDAYFVNNLRFDYPLKQRLFKEVKFHLLINNLFDSKYESNAWVYSYIYNSQRYKMDGYFPQAGTNFLLSVNIGF
jgi:iron complex outermembrane recepter protein